RMAHRHFRAQNAPIASVVTQMMKRNRRVSCQLMERLGSRDTTVPREDSSAITMRVASAEREACQQWHVVGERTPFPAIKAGAVHGVHAAEVDAVHAQYGEPRRKGTCMAFVAAQEYFLQAEGRIKVARYLPAAPVVEVARHHDCIAALACLFQMPVQHAQLLAALEAEQA